MSDKWPLEALGLCQQSLTPFVKRELLPNGFNVNPRIKTYWAHLEALYTVLEIATGFASWDMLVG